MISAKSFNAILSASCIMIYSLSFASIIEYNKTNNILSIGGSIQLLEDRTNKLTIDQVIASNDFKKSTQEVPNLSISPHTYWAKIQIKNLTDTESLLLNLAHPIIDEVEFYSILPHGSINIEKLGEYKPFKERKYNYQDYLFDIHLAKNEIGTYYLKVRSGDQIEMRLLIGTPKAIFESLTKEDFYFGIYTGIVLVMCLYNLFIYIVVRDKSYLLYVIYSLLVGLTQACIHGYTFKYLWPNFPSFATQSMQLVPAVAGIALIEFSKLFLQTKKHTPVLHKIFFVLIFIYIISIILSLLKVFNLSQQLVQTTALLLSIYLLYISSRISLKGYRPAKFFLFAWSIFLVCVVIFVLQTAFSLVPSTSFGSNTLIFGSATEVLLLSFALADRINIMKKEKEESQAQTLFALKENEKIITNQNILLESKVKERTYALEASNKELKETQTQLVSVEKMASLGQLTAGIAHEINNPINFVISNIKPLRRDVEEILQVLAKYGEITNDTDLKEKLKEIDALKQTLDTDYVIEEINLLLKGIDEGAFRTSEIVKGLQSFSRLDESDLKRVNIHEGIDATLVLLNNNIIKEKIEIIKNYDRTLPQIECYPGKLNQVFMNVINNAIQSLESSKNRQTEERKIIIKIKAEGNNAVISIKDNGTGIPENIKSKIFEPFFTTKDVGSGTGLGLSIAYGIIQSHKGNIKVESEENKGAEFIITLPVTHS